MRKIQLDLVAGGPSRIVVDETDISDWVTAVRILARPWDVPALQVEIRGDITVNIPEGLIGLMDGIDPTAILTEAVDQLDPAGLETAILAELGGLNGPNSTGEAAVAALRKWAAGYGGA